MGQFNKQELARRELAIREILRRDFEKFIRGYDDKHPGAWAVLEPNTPLDWNWHHAYIAEILTDVALGNTRRLLVNVMPRSLKSLLVSVFFPCWVWLRQPWASFLCMSYSTPLANDLSYKRRQVIESEWYQRLSRGRCVLSDNRNRITEYSNNSGGIIYARGLDGSVTGVGGTYIICLPSHQRITTSRGEIPIGDIVNKKLDVDVATFNHETGEVEWQPILRYEENPGREIIEIELEDGSILECTNDHPVWVEGKGYIKAGDMEPGDAVLCL
ncbi:MAG: hypothetical protein HC862_03050 [Scytonema sp. RU_4_4]|nr:hypothetical protein [Scytonema sp. RU_4_4]